MLRQTLDELYAFGAGILGCSVVPVGLTEYSKHHLVREPTAAECQAAIALIDERSATARRERGRHWAYGADELYLRAGVELPPAEIYDDFDQVENGVGSVRWLQRRIASEAGGLDQWSGQRIGVVTGTAMGQLMPMVLEPLRSATGAAFELIALENPLFGASVTTAGLLPGRAFADALRARGDLDLVLLPGESVNDDGLFIDSMSLAALRAEVPCRASPLEGLRRRARPAGGGVSKPTVAIVGRPNVGKSTLFNRILGGRPAIVSERPGTTRDRHFGDAEWQGRHFWLVDTGGLVPDSDDSMDRAIRQQVEFALDESDLVVFLVDGKDGVHPVDQAIAERLRRTRRAGAARGQQARRPGAEHRAVYEFFELGLGEPVG